MAGSFKQTAQNDEEEEEFEEEQEEDYEDEMQQTVSVAPKNQARATRTNNLKRGKTNATMKTINRDAQSLVENSQTTFQGTKQ